MKLIIPPFQRYLAEGFSIYTFGDMSLWRWGTWAKSDPSVYQQPIGKPMKILAFLESA